MREAFLRAMDMKISQSEAFFNDLSIHQVKMRLYRVKMMTYNENIKKNRKRYKNIEKNDFSFFVPMSQEMLNFKFREFSNSESGRKTDTKNST